MSLLFGPVQPGDDFVAARCALSWQPPRESIEKAVHLGYLEKVVQQDDSGNHVVSYQFSKAVYAASTREAVMDMVLLQCQHDTA